MLQMLKCFVRRFTPDPHLEALLRRNREALEKKRREARIAVQIENTVTEEFQHGT
jgi:hypothetical protein